MDCLSFHGSNDWCLSECIGLFKEDGNCDAGCMTKDCNWDNFDCCGK